jgi:cytochrome c peroxidase
MKSKLAGLMGLVLIMLLVWAFNVKPKQPIQYYRPYVLQEMELTVDELVKIRNNKTNLKLMQQAYYASRKHYKHIECFIEYYSPVESKYMINGPLVPKNDPEFGNVIAYPNGFQTIEECLFSGEPLDTLVLTVKLTQLINQLDYLKQHYTTLKVESEALLEMFQYELYRIASLYLNGYDATFTFTNLEEIKYSLEGLEFLAGSFKMYKANSNYHPLIEQIKKAKTYVAKNTDYNSFNRLDFIKNHLLQVNAQMVRFHNGIGLPWTSTKKALRLNQEYLFGEESFNTRYFSVYYGDTNSIPEKQQLGKKLFFDPHLSGNGKRSCATCHSPDLAFTDGFPRSIHLNDQTELSRNAPTLLNVIFQQSFFYDGRVYQLEQQIFEVVHNKEEMDGNIQLIVDYLKTNKEYQQLFKKAFNGTRDTNITPYATLLALAEYERTLISLNSRFDQYLRGDQTQLSPREINGYNIFGGKALCGSCHFFPLFNGTVPPSFMDTEFEVIGISSTSENKQLDPDQGRYALSGMEIHRFAFKTPTVRNIALTAPYMHNGAYKTLEEVVEFYHRGGGNGFGYNIPNQTLPFDSLQLNQTEKEDIVLFLKSLTDTVSYKMGR